MANTGLQAHLSAGKRARSYQGTSYPHGLSAVLVNDGTTIEMTPTERGAAFRFRFPGSGGRVILEPVKGESSIDVIDEQTVSGWVSGNSGGVTQGFKHYFYVEFNQATTHIEGFHGEKQILDFMGDRVGFVAHFANDVELKIATSFISVEQAKRNLELELSADFDTLLSDAEQAWETQLGLITVESGDVKKLKTFYTCLYRTQLFPRIWHEVKPDGSLYHRSPYSGNVHDGPLYTDNGFWDTYRTVYPLFSLIQPERLAQILEGWTNAYKEGGWFPQWASPGYRACMVGTHIDAVMADGIARGITDFDIASALEGMLKHSIEVGDAAGAWGRIGIEDYLKHGFVSSNHHESVARSLDYAYDDWCIAQVVHSQGLDSAPLLDSATNYAELYDANVGFMRAKNLDGSWVEPWDEFHWGNPYVEGGPWQASWAVQHDAGGLIRLMGGENAFVAKLDRMLSTPPYFTTGAYDMEIHEMTEMAMANFGQYAHSNQPVHHVLYLYNAAGRPWRTQQEVRRVLAELYSPDDQPGDEDNGEMSAWYVLSALGIFPQTPGHPSWTVSSPIFDKATINLGGNKSLVVLADSESDVFVSEVQLNGELLERLYLTQDEVAKGGTLAFKLSDTPNQTVVPSEGRPYSYSSYPGE
jgi:predicted alpha-1,2-mannosidase